MQVCSYTPTTDALAAGLAHAFRRPGTERGAVSILSREENVYASTFPSEVVTIACEGAPVRRVFCKYGSGHAGPVKEHKAGVPYEASVYDRVLGGLRLPLP